MTTARPLPDLYADHHARLLAHYESLLAASGWPGVVISSGSPAAVFGDDQAHPFRVNPRFRQWIPEGEYSQSFLVIQAGDRPRFICHQPVDYWHLGPRPKAAVQLRFTVQACGDRGAGCHSALPLGQRGNEPLRAHRCSAFFRGAGRAVGSAPRVRTQGGSHRFPHDPGFRTSQPVQVVEAASSPIASLIR